MGIWLLPQGPVLGLSDLSGFGHLSAFIECWQVVAPNFHAKCLQMHQLSWLEAGLSGSHLGPTGQQGCRSDDYVSVPAAGSCSNGPGSLITGPGSTSGGIPSHCQANRRWWCSTMALTGHGIYILRGCVLGRLGCDCNMNIVPLAQMGQCYYGSA